MLLLFYILRYLPRLHAPRPSHRRSERWLGLGVLGHVWTPPSAWAAIHKVLHLARTGWQKELVDDLEAGLAGLLPSRALVVAGAVVAPVQRVLLRLPDALALWRECTLLCRARCHRLGLACVARSRHYHLSRLYIPNMEFYLLIPQARINDEPLHVLANDLHHGERW